MFGFNNKIIVVDDNQDDLSQICNEFHQRGIGCRGFLYDGLTFPSEPLCGIQIAFFDINLIQGNNNTEIYSALKDAISQYISESNGPYVLVFWTNRTDLIADFKDFVNRTNDNFKQKLKPIALSAIDKNDFLDPTNSLEEKLETIFDIDIVKCLFSFDDSIARAAWQTLSEILNTIPFDESWGETDKFSNNCKDVFSKIAINTYGFIHARKNPDNAIKEAIVLVFQYSLLKEDNRYWEEYLSNLQKAKKNEDINYPKNYKVSTLNTIFHIDTIHCECKTNRGAVCLINSSDEKSLDMFEETFGCSYYDWYSRLLPGAQKKDRNQSTLIAIEFSAACDFSNNKKRTYKYLLGVIVSPDVYDKIEREKIGDYALLLPYIFNIQGEEKRICINLNYTFAAQATSLILKDTLFVLKKEIMDMIGNKYANHVSRIGITGFY